MIMNSATKLRQLFGGWRNRAQGAVRARREGIKGPRSVRERCLVYAVEAPEYSGVVVAVTAGGMAISIG